MDHPRGGGLHQGLCRFCLALSAALAAAALATSGCGRAGAPIGAPDRVMVVASISPLARFAEAVGGDRVHVEQIVPAGASPHTFEPQPAHLRALSEADLLVLNGVGLEFWMAGMIEAAGNPGLKVVETAAGLDIIQEEAGPETTAAEGRPSGHRHDDGRNPHVWLDPIAAIHQVERIRDALIQADPEGAEGYRANAAAFIGRLHELDDEIRNAVASFTRRSFISQHAAWVHFARRYGLTQAAVVEPSPGREPSPQEIAEVVAAVRATGAAVVFAEPQLSQKAAEVIAREAEARVIVLDPLGPAGLDYIAMMQENLRKLKEGLG